jgi:hypothetical protein
MNDADRRQLWNFHASYCNQTDVWLSGGDDDVILNAVVRENTPATLARPCSEGTANLLGVMLV